MHEPSFLKMHQVYNQIEAMKKHNKTIKINQVLIKLIECNFKSQPENLAEGSKKEENFEFALFKLL